MSEGGETGATLTARTGASAPEPLRWGVIGATSTVARRAVLPAIASSSDARLVAMASRAFAGGLSVPRVDRALAALMAPLYPSGVRRSARYQDVLDDPDVEAVYIPLPNGLHAEWTRRSAAAGKHVLCEKPLCLDPVEAWSMVEACKSAGVVLAEAYVTPFHPRSQRLAELVSSGALGELLFAHTAFTFHLDRPDDHRWDPALGGGALADVGIYCLAPILVAAGRRPLAIAGAGRFTSKGVDASVAGWLDFGEGFCASVECSFEVPERQLLEFVGTGAAVSVERAFTPGPSDTGFDLRHRDGSVTRVETGGADPYLKMIEDFAAVVRENACPTRTASDAVALLEVADELRRAAVLHQVVS
jgi:predicted dehydrogenase